MQHAKTTILSAVVLLVLAYFGAVRFSEYYLASGTRSYIVAAIIWLLCLALVHKPQQQ